MPQSRKGDVPCYRSRAPPNTLIAPEKLTQYLLTLRKRNDKSQWLFQAGYTIENWQLLEKDLRTQILSLDAIPTENTKYGQMYEIKGNLTGPNGKSFVEHHPVTDGEDGYTLEVFNALGDTISVITVSELAIAPLTEKDIFSVRPLAV